MKSGFRSDPGGKSMSDKWFSEAREGVERFRKNLPELEGIVHAKVPKDIYERSYRHPNIDNNRPEFCV